MHVHGNIRRWTDPLPIGYNLNHYDLVPSSHLAPRRNRQRI